MVSKITERQEEETIDFLKLVKSLSIFEYTSLKKDLWVKKIFKLCLNAWRLKHRKKESVSFLKLYFAAFALINEENFMRK